MAGAAVTIALIADRNVEAGLHGTLQSALENTPGEIEFILLSAGLAAEHRARIEATVGAFGGRATIDIRQVPLDAFAGLPGLHGNIMPFVKLCLADEIDRPRILYLDSDLIIHCDLRALFETDLEGHALGASGVGMVRHAIEGPFFAELGIGPDASYFNSGVMLIDTAEWHAHGISRKCYDFAAAHPQQLPTADQSVLNAVFIREGFLALPDRYNTPVYPLTPRLPDSLGDGIYHFLGSPKPWDLFGEQLHRNYPVYEAAVRRSAFRSLARLSPFDLHRVKRAARLSRSYLKLVQGRLRG